MNDNSKSNVKRIKAYKELCMVTNKDIVEKGGYRNSTQYLGQLLNLQKPCSEESMYEILNAISKARAVKIKNKQAEIERKREEKENGNEVHL